MEHYPFKLVSDFEPEGDQPEAIRKIVNGVNAGERHQTLLGATGTGKTFTMSNVIKEVGKPTLIIAHNKTLAGQLYSEFKEFFPENRVEYFVSYYDYYQPEAYVPSTDTFIEKDASINDEIDQLRHSATSALFERDDVIIIASVSCIYGLGNPDEYRDLVVSVRVGMEMDRSELLRKLVDVQYTRNDIDFRRGTFRVRGDVVEIFPASREEMCIRVEFFGDEIDRIREVNYLTGEVLRERDHFAIFPASHFVTREEKMKSAIQRIENELAEQLEKLRSENKLLEAQRLEQRTNYDLEMMREMGFCSGIENYSVHLTLRPLGSTPYTLMDYFGDDWLVMIDESHVTLPQIRGMYNGDRARKQVLVDHGFRLPSALDNRPLQFEEFESKTRQLVYVSATPGPYELEHTDEMVEQIIRPTGLLDPKIDVRPTENQIDDLLGEIQGRIENDERVLITTLTKKMSEDCSNRLPNGCSEPSASCFVPAGKAITVSATSPILDSFLVVIKAILAPTECAFSANNLRCSVDPEPEIIINKSCSLIDGVVASPIADASFPSWFKRIAKLLATYPERPLPAVKIRDAPTTSFAKRP